MTEIYLDYYHLHSLTTDLPSRVKQPFDGLGLPDIRQDLYNRPGTHGQTLAHTLYAGRLITLQGIVRGSSTSVYRSNRQAFVQACGLQLDSNNRPVLRTLSVTDLAGNTYETLVATRSLDFKDIYPTLTNWQLQLVAPDYRWLSAAAQTLTMGLPVSGGVTYPVTYPVTYGASSGGSGTATNNGTEAANPTITFHGPLVNPVITNVTTGEHLSLSLTLVAGDVVTVDTANYTIVQGTSTNRMSSLASGSTFWQLQPGANALTFAANTFDTGTVGVSWADSYLGL